MRYLFGDCTLELVTGHILSAQVDAIVNPTDSTLAHSGMLAGDIARQAGDSLGQECAQLLREYGQLESGMALFTGAGELPYRAIIHAIVPGMGEGDEQRKLELAISRSLQVCEMNEWCSVAFPTFTDSGLPVSICAPALFRAITRFWDARHDTSLRQVSIYLNEAQYAEFQASLHAGGDLQEEPTLRQGGPAEKIGYVDLSGEEPPQADDEIDSWFK